MCCLLASPSSPSASVGVLWGTGSSNGLGEHPLSHQNKPGTAEPQEELAAKRCSSCGDESESFRSGDRQKSKVPGGIKESWEGAEQ